MNRETEYCILVEKKEADIKFCGWGAYDFVHQQGLRHMTVQIILVAQDSGQKEPKILLHRRSEHRTVGANRLDFCGGHVSFNDKYTSSSEWDDPAFLTRVSYDAALDEAKEELVCDPKVEFDKNQLHLFGEIGEFEAETVGKDIRRNVEFSSAFVLNIPKGYVVKIREKVRGKDEEQIPEKYTLDELIEIFQETPDDFADGAGRVLKKIFQSPSLKQNFLDLLNYVVRD
jgi:8-oxo-dGTP pyrophosphatase MutT (NUDIX family)